MSVAAKVAIHDQQLNQREAFAERLLHNPPLERGETVARLPFVMTSFYYWMLNWVVVES